jgi:hypothetical protein
MTTGAGNGGSFESGRAVCARADARRPGFPLRVYRDPKPSSKLSAISSQPSAIGSQSSAAKPYQLSDLELASRLSFFLWSSIPDDQLLSLAEQRKLSVPAVLEQQVKRMLADPRASDALVDDFAAQWLNLAGWPRSSSILSAIRITTSR